MNEAINLEDLEVALHFLHDQAVNELNENGERAKGETMGEKILDYSFNMFCSGFLKGMDAQKNLGKETAEK